MGHFLFGMHLATFSTMGRALISCFKLATGTQDDTGHQELLQADPGIANLYFLSFFFVVVFVLFNILLAIIVDAYGGAADESRETISIAQDASDALTRLLYKLAFLKGKKTVSSERLARAVSALSAQGKREVSVDDIAALCGVSDVSALDGHPDITEIREEEPDVSSESNKNRQANTVWV